MSRIKWAVEDKITVVNADGEAQTLVSVKKTVTLSNG